MTSANYYNTCNVLINKYLRPMQRRANKVKSLSFGCRMLLPVKCCGCTSRNNFCPKQNSDDGMPDMV